MSLFHAAVLGLIQGLTEFLPISSSAHLALAPKLLGWSDPGLTFDVALHVGTLLAVAAFFWKDWLRLIRAGFGAGVKTPDGRLFWTLAAASLPGAVAGVLFESQAETTFRSPYVIAGALAGMGLIMLFADRAAGGRASGAPPTFGRGMAIGLAQALAIVPGVSRSGATMTAGLFTGLSREAAARFSFLLSAPLIAGAAVFKLRGIKPASVGGPFLVGIVVSALTGFLVIGGLLRWLQRRGFRPFAVYRILLAATVVLIALLG